MFSIITWIVLGFIIGALAKFIMPGRDPGGFIVTTLLGIAGAFVGGYISTLLGFGNPNSFSLPGVIFSVIGAVILLAVYRMLVKR